MDNLIRFACPKCGKTLKATPEQAGRRGHCSCGQQFRVPGEKPEPEPEETQAPPLRQAPARRRAQPEPTAEPRRRRTGRWWRVLAGVAVVLLVAGAGYLWLTSPSAAQEAIYKDYIRTGNELVDMHRALTDATAAEAASGKLNDKAQENLDAWKKKENLARAVSLRKHKALEEKFEAEVAKMEERRISLVKDYLDSKIPILAAWGGKGRQPGNIRFFLPNDDGTCSVFSLSSSTTANMRDTDPPTGSATIVAKPSDDKAARLAALAGDWETPALSLKIDKAGHGTYVWLFGNGDNFTEVVGDLSVQHRDGKTHISMSPTVFGNKQDYIFLAKLSDDGATLDLQETADQAKPKTLKRKGAPSTPPPPVVKSKPDPDVQGTWKLITVYDKYENGERSFIVVSSKYVMTIDDNSMTVESEGNGKTVVAKYAVAFDQEKNPKVYTQTPAEGEKKAAISGIYTIRDGKLWLCSQADGKPPDSFTVKRDDGKDRAILEFVRVNK